MRDILGYEGRRVVVTGAYSGMGAAAASLLVELGAEVHALDIKEVAAPVKQYVQTDLGVQESIDAAVAVVPGEIDALFNCAGLPGPPFSNLETTLVNFVGLRHLTESLLTRIPDGGAVASISSVAGMGYPKNMENVAALLATPDFASALAWCEGHPAAVNGYLFSKQCIIAYTIARAGELAKRGVRINCISPAPTDTPMMKTFHEQISKQFMDEHFQAPVGRNASSEEMAEPLLLLNSRAARFVSGVNLYVDFGYTAQVEAGQRPALL